MFFNNFLDQLYKNIVVHKLLMLYHCIEMSCYKVLLWQCSNINGCATCGGTRVPRAAVHVWHMRRYTCAMCGGTRVHRAAVHVWHVRHYMCATCGITCVLCAALHVCHVRHYMCATCGGTRVPRAAVHVWHVRQYMCDMCRCCQLVNLVLLVSADFPCLSNDMRGEIYCHLVHTMSAWLSKHVRLWLYNYAK